MHHKACQGLHQKSQRLVLRKAKKGLHARYAAMMYTSLLPVFLASHVQPCMFSNGLGFDLPSINSNKEPSPGMFLFSAAQQIFKSPSKEKSSSFSLCLKKVGMPNSQNLFLCFEFATKKHVNHWLASFFPAQAQEKKLWQLNEKPYSPSKKS